MSKYEAQYGYPKADISVYSNVVHVLPPKLDGRTDDDGQPVFTHDYALKEQTIREYSGAIADLDLRERVEAFDENKRTPDTLTADLMREVAEHFAHELEMVPCNRCGDMIWIDDWAGYYARNKCSECADTCPECGASYSETKSLKQRNASVRKGNIYVCDPDDGGCGRTWEGIVTG